MKKTLCACMAAVLALASLPVLGASAEETTYALGDVDMDGVVTNDDATMISRYVLGCITLTEEQLKLADVNEDGVVDLTDVTKLYNEKKIYVLGDVDMDGVVTGHDTAMVSRYVLDDTYTLTEEQLKLADVNEDGTVDQADADKLYTEMQVYPLGDIDMDGEVTVSDAVSILTYYSKTSAGQSVELTAVQKNLIDVDLNGKIDVEDACYDLHGYARRAAKFAYIYSENTNQYYYDPIKIVVIDRNDSDSVKDYIEGKYDDADVTVPKTNA